MRFNELTEQRVQEGNYDDGMQPIDLTTNPSLKALMSRHSQLYYQGMEDTTSDEEMAEEDAIEQYTLEKFGQQGLDNLNNATLTNFWGRKDGRGSGGYRSSNLGTASAPVGNFRTTKAGKMHSQDVKTMKNKVADRLGRHPEPALPEGAVSEVWGDNDRHMNDPLDGENIFSVEKPLVAKRALSRLKALLTVRLFAEDELRMMHLYDVVQDKQLFDIIKYAKRNAPPKTDLRNYEPFSNRIQTLIARAEKKLNLNQSQEQGVAEGEGDLATALSKLSGSWSGWHKEEDMSSPDVDVYEYDDGEGGYYGRGTIEHNLKSGEVKVEYHDSENDADVVGTFKNMGDAMRALRGEHGVNHGGRAPNFDRLGQRKQHGPDDLRKTDRTGRKGTLAGGPTNSLKQAIQWNKGKHGPVGKLPESMEEGNLYSMALQRYPQLKQVDRETVINALNGAYEDYLMHYGYEGIGPDEESSMIDHAVKGLNKGVSEAGNNYHANRTGFARPSGQRDDERHDLDVARPTIYGLKINGKIWKKDGNTVTFFTKERALAAKNSMLNKRPELEITLVQRPQD